MRGWWNMHCWNGLSEAQQLRLVEHGNLPFGYAAEGWCEQPAEVEVTTCYDRSPGPRFYCIGCAVDHLQALRVS